MDIFVTIGVFIMGFTGIFYHKNKSRSSRWEMWISVVGWLLFTISLSVYLIFNIDNIVNLVVLAIGVGMYLVGQFRAILLDIKYDLWYELTGKNDKERRMKKESKKQDTISGKNSIVDGD